MIKVGLLYLLLIFPVCIFAQTEETEKKEEEKKVVVVDSLYREDQFYIIYFKTARAVFHKTRFH